MSGIKFKKKGMDVSWLPLAMAGGGLDPAVSAWVSAVQTAGGTVSGGQQTAVNTMVLGLKSANLWTKLDRLWLHASENTFQAKIDIVGLNTLASVAPATTFTANSGYVSNGSGTGWLDTGFIPSSSGINFVPATSSSMGIYSTHIVGGAVTTMGCLNASGAGCLLQCNAFSLDVGSQNSGSISVSPTTPGGLYTISRTSSTALSLYKNGSSTAIVSGSKTVIAIPTVSMYVLAQNNNGTLAQVCRGDISSIVFIGAGLASTDIPNLSSVLNGYMTTLGTNVY